MKHRKLWAYLLGVGLVLFVVHNPLLTISRSDGMVWFFLPDLALLLLVMVAFTSIACLSDVPRIFLTDKVTGIPLLALAGFMIVSGIITHAPAISVFAVVLLVVYLASGRLGEQVYTPFVIGSVITSISVIVMGVIYPGRTNGGLVSPTNYDIAAGVIILGAMLAPVRHRWWVTALGAVGIYFSGAVEGWFALAVILVVGIYRRDWGYFENEVGFKFNAIVVPVATLVVCILVGSMFGISQRLYFNTVNDYKEAVIESSPRAVEDSIKWEAPHDTIETITYGTPTEAKWDWALHGRWSQYKKAVNNMSFWGHGYKIMEFDFWTVHDVPLIIMDQIGVVAMLAWIWVTLVMYKRTRSYAWLAILALSVFDHYLWTQAAPWWWALSGISTKGRVYFENTIH